jgi:tRNA(fMet)-specific endonuclease VapC
MSVGVFDTDALTLFKENHPVVVPKVLARPRQELAITVMTVEEVLSGWYTLLRRVNQPSEVASAYQEMADSIPFLAEWPILAYPGTAIARYEQLLAMRLNVRKMDLRIAAIILENGGTLVTRNTRDFQRVPGLTIEDWTV